MERPDCAPEPGDERFSEQLLAYDQAIADGTLNQAADSATPDGLWAERLRGAQACLRLMEQVWRSGSGQPGSEVEANPKCVTQDSPRAGSGDEYTLWSTCSHIGRFTIQRVLGRGGGGVVFLAHDPVMSRDVALKVPRPEYWVTTESRARFLREARAVAGLNHPNIVPAYEAGEAGPIWYIASEFCAGPTLAAWLGKRSASVAPTDAATLLVKLALAVQHAHSRGILHRDIKPSNVLLAHRDQTHEGDRIEAGRAKSGHAELDQFEPKLTDFGLAKIIEPDGDETATGLALGTAKYMAPEQCDARFGDVASHTDVYALGVMLFELLTLQVPFQGASNFEISRRLCEVEPPSPSVINPKVSRDLEAICSKCLAKRPADRYATADSLAQDLQRFLAGEPVHARRTSSFKRATKWMRRRPAVATAVVAACVVVSTFVLFAWWTSVRLREQNRLLLVSAEGERRQKDRAVMHEEVAREQARLVGRHLHASNLRLVQQFHGSGRYVEAAALLQDPRNWPRDPPGFEWHYWRGRSIGELREVKGFAAPVRALAFSPDGRLLVAACLDDTLAVLNATTGERLASITASQPGLRHIEFLSDRRLFASSGRQPAYEFVDITSGETPQTFSVPLLFQEAARRPLNTLLLRAQKVLVTTGGEEINFWNASDGRRVRGFSAPSAINHASLSPDGTRLAVSSLTEPIAWLYDVESGAELHRLTGHTHPTFCLAFSPDGARLATASADGSVRIWATSSGAITATLAGHSQEVTSVAWSPDGTQLATVSNDRTARLWNATTGSALARAATAGAALYSVAFSPDGDSIAFAGDGDSIGMWRPDVQTERSLAGHESETWCVAFLPSSTVIVTGSDDETIRFWDRRTGAELARLIGHTSTVASLAISGDGRMLASASLDSTVRLWNLKIGSVVAKTDEAKPVVRASERASCVGHDGKVRCVAIAPNGLSIASGGYDRTVRIWDAETGLLRSTLSGHEGRVRALAFTPDGAALVSTGDDGSIRLWDLATGISRWVSHDLIGVWCVAVSPDGRTLATGNGKGFVRLWDAATGESRSVLTGHTHGVRSVAFSPDGQTLASGSMDRTIRLWDPVTQQELTVLRGHGHYVNSVAFAPDGQTLASCSHDGAVQLWYAASGD